jgi:hypothetical protein
MTMRWRDRRGCVLCRSISCETERGDERCDERYPHIGSCVGVARSCWHARVNPSSVTVTLTLLVPLNINVRREVDCGKPVRVANDSTTIVPDVGQT